MLHGWISLAIGLAAASVFVIQARTVVRNFSRARRWRHADAEVVSTRTASDNQFRTAHVATYAFLADDGRTRTGHADVGRQMPSGARLEVLYDPADPARSQPLRRPTLAYIGPGVLGLLFFLVGVFGIVNGVLELTTGHGIE